MQSVFTIDDNGQGMEEVRAFLRERGYSVTESSQETCAEQRFTKFVVDRASVQVIVLNRDDLRIICVNDAACRALGYTREELTQMALVDIDPWCYERDDPELAEKWKNFHETRHARFETRHRAKDGRIYPVEIQVNFLEFEGKEYNCCFVTDISERKRDEEARWMSRFIVDNASIGIYRGREDGRILYANEHSARMLGYTREELSSMRFSDIVPAITEESWIEYRRQLRAEGFLKFEAVHRRKDGTTLPVEVTVNYLEFGDHPFSCSFAQDITERKKAEEALRESEKKFRLLTETSPNAIIVIRGDRIVYANPAATHVSGFTREQLLNMEFWNFVQGDFREVARERLLARMRGEPVSNRYEYRIIDSKGEDRCVLATSVPMDYEGTHAILVNFTDITETKRAEESLRESEARLKLAMEMAKLVQWEFDATTGMFRFDDQFYTLYGTSAEREGGTLMSAESYVRRFVHPEDMADVIAVMQLVLSNRYEASTGGMEHCIIRADGAERHISVRFDVIRDREGRIVRTRGANQDITERKRAEEQRMNLEEQLHQAQKMDAIGQLAGGVAHDFNNILTAIMGFAEVTAMRMEQGDPHEHHVRQILSAAERAADLTRSLLVFSRKQVLHVRAIEVCEVVDGVKKMLRRLIPEDIDFRVKSAATGMIVMADKGQIEQVLMNLVTNARDAMPTGGILTIEAGPVVVDDDTCYAHGFGIPGRYARIAVEDTGCGMDEETREKIFEPFFTTKQVGKGTGLGLSIIYGIVKQHNGFITVDSLPGRGTTFCVYLPLVDQEKQELSALGRPEPAPGGTETILLAEDDDVVRELNRAILEDAGYTVIETSDGREALEMFKERGACVDILVTDLIMPTMDGKRLYEEIAGIRPDMKVLFMSGYSTEILDGRGFSDDGINFMPKPVLPSELLKRLREILDRT
jgi:PAS domain S-box-containing protein